MTNRRRPVFDRRVQVTRRTRRPGSRVDLSAESPFYEMFAPDSPVKRIIVELDDGTTDTYERWT